MEQQQPGRSSGGFLRRFRRDRRGAIAPLAAVVITAALIGVGASIDISRLVTARTQIQDATDSADLALARMPVNTSSADMQTKAQAWINANVTDPNIYNIVVSTPVRGANQITLNVTGSIKTTFASLMGVTSLPLGGHSTVNYGVTKVELALVLDNTGSMNEDNKLSSLKSAATTLVNTLQQSAQASGLADALKVAIVPFTETVNIGASNQGQPWLTGAMPADYGTNADVVDPAGHADRFKLLAKMGVKWGGCVESRPMPYDVQETAPDKGTPATLFVPFFSPDTPDEGYYNAGPYGVVYHYGTYAAGASAKWANSKVGGTSATVFSANNYLPDAMTTDDGTKNSSTGGNWLNHQTNVAKYTAAPAANTSNVYWGDNVGPNSGCDVQPLQRLTTDTSTVLSQINNMTAGGSTEIPIGLVWGWHVLSPLAPFANGVAYGTPNTLKVIVLVTDGANTYGSSTYDYNLSLYTSHALAASQRITSNQTASAVQSALDDRLTALCNNMKVRNSDGTWRINIYTVPLEVTDANTKSMLQGCVTDPANYLDTTSSSQLAATFQNIAGSIQQLRVSH